MAKKIIIQMTDVELTAIIDIIDTLSAMLGTGDEGFDGMDKTIRKVDKMLLKNGYKRKYN